MSTQITFTIDGDPSKAIAALNKFEGQAAKSTGKAQSSFTKLGGTFQKMGAQIGGEFGEVLDKVGQGLENIGEKGATLGQKFAVGGAALAGAGVLLTSIGDKEKAASQQLDQAITNTGNSADDFKGQIDHTVHSMEKYGDSASTTKNALQTLVSATHDPTKALGLMGEAADLAAAKHESLSEASTQLARVIGGKGGRTLAQYNIQLVKNADGTTNWTATNQKLAQVLSGQAAASADTFTGKLKHLKTEIGDQIAVIGQRFGPAITGVGTALMAAGSVAQIFAARSAATAAANAASAASSEADAAAIADQGAAAAATAAELTALAGAAEAAGVASAAGAAESGAATGGGMLSKLKGLAGGAGPILAVGAAVVGLGAGINHLDGDYAKWAALQKNIGNLLGTNKQAVDSFSQSVEQDGGKIGTLTQHLLGAQLESQGFAKGASDAGISLSSLITGVSGTDGQFQSLMATWKQSGKLTVDQATALFGLRKALMDGKTAAGDLGTATDDLGAAQKRAATRAATLKQETDDLNTALQNLGQTQIGDLQSQDAFLSSLDSLTKGVKDNGTSLSVNTEKGRANREAFLQAGSSALAYAQAQQKNGVAIPTVTKNLEANVQQLIATATNAHMSKKQISDLITQMGLTPKQIETAFNAITAPAAAKLAGYITKLQSYDGKTIHTYVQVSAIGAAADYGVSGGSHPGGSSVRLDAQGTGYFRSFAQGVGNLAWVGEYGPELVKLPTGASVHTASQSASLIGGHGGGDTIVIVQHFDGIADSVTVQQAVHKALETGLNRGNRLHIPAGSIVTR